MFSTVPEYLFADSFIQGMANSVLEKEVNIPKRDARHLKYLCPYVIFSSSKNGIPVFQKCYSRLPKILFPSFKNFIHVF